MSRGDHSTMNHLDRYLDHIHHLQSEYGRTLDLLRAEKVHIDGVLLHSGTRKTYFADDETVPFRAHGHFLHWLPIERPDQMVLVLPDRRPTYYRVQRKTYWDDSAIDVPSGCDAAFDIVDLDTPEQLIDHLPDTRRIAFMGEDTDFASTMGLPSFLHNETHLRNRLNYHRSIKTPHEIACIREANRIALRGHHAAQEAFLAHRSEQKIHDAYLAACGVQDSELPFRSIVALDEKSAILHYEHRRTEPGDDSRVLLVDAGYRHLGYAADITRTYASDHAHPTFRELVSRVESIQVELAASARAGMRFKDLNAQAHRVLLEALLDLDIVRGDAGELASKNVTALFFPHGLGHLLGLQVHDVGGLFKDETGVLEPPPHEHKALRLTRKLEQDMVITIEPGVYFIPMLLDPERAGARATSFNFPLIDELIPHGGVRIEDNVLIRADGVENLTRG